MKSAFESEFLPSGLSPAAMFCVSIKDGTPVIVDVGSWPDGTKGLGAVMFKDGNWRPNKVPINRLSPVSREEVEEAVSERLGSDGVQ
jgi:hypothetical protein